MKTDAFYCVYEDTCYKNFSNVMREDIGIFYVKTTYVHSLKEALKAGTKMCEDFINEDVYEDEYEANKVALERTIKKLNEVKRKLKNAK